MLMMEKPKMSDFQIAGGSIVGRRHLGKKNLLVGKNNQDAFDFTKTSDNIIAVVCDGCGSSIHSEIGATLGCEWVVKIISDLFKTEFDLTEIWQELYTRIILNIQNTARTMNGNYIDQIMEKFLFTIVGCIITPEQTAIFSIGDGIYFINEKEYNLGPFFGNAPPFIGYSCVPKNLFAYPPESEELEFKINYYDTQNIQSLLIGTDGVKDLMEAATENIAGSEDLIGDISQFWSDDIYFKNNDALRRKLAVINREYTEIKEINGQKIQLYEVGPLQDDTTMITIRRKP